MKGIAKEWDELDGRVLRAALSRVPLFPLPNAVLFPHALLPLHIFEPRYRKMTRDVLGGPRLICVALIDGAGRRDVESAGAESDPAARPPVVAVAGVGEVVMAHELPDGRYNLILRGRERVRIVEELDSEEPYRLVHAVPIPDRPPEDAKDLEDAEASLRALVGHLAESIPEGGEILRQVAAAQPTPAELCDVIGAALIADVGVRQRLLETPDVLRRIERVANEVVAMTGRIGSPSKAN